MPAAATAVIKIVPHARVDPPVTRREPPLPLEDPQELRKRLSRGLAVQVFPVLDSRTRYWRYYLLIGPRRAALARKNWGTSTLGRRLFRVLRDNYGGNRGVGRRMRARNGRRARHRVVEALHTQYAPAARRFWALASERCADRALAAAAEQIQSGPLEGFFDDRPDAPARKVFHRLLRTQTGEAHALAPALLRHGDVYGAVLDAMRRQSLSDAARGVLFTYAVLRCLYQPAPPARGFDPEDEDDEELLPLDSRDLRAMAEASLRWIRRDRVPGLAPAEGVRLAAYLRSGRKPGGGYAPPLPSPPPRRGRGRINVFSGLRLGAFHRLLWATR